MEKTKSCREKERDTDRNRLIAGDLNKNIGKKDGTMLEDIMETMKRRRE